MEMWNRNKNQRQFFLPSDKIKSFCDFHIPGRTATVVVQRVEVQQDGDQVNGSYEIKEMFYCADRYRGQLRWTRWQPGTRDSGLDGQLHSLYGSPCQLVSYHNPLPLPLLTAGPPVQLVTHSFAWLLLWQAKRVHLLLSVSVCLARVLAICACQIVKI